MDSDLLPFSSSWIPPIQSCRLLLRLFCVIPTSRRSIARLEHLSAIAAADLHTLVTVNDDDPVQICMAGGG